jgi:chromosome segregation ATPase
MSETKTQSISINGKDYDLATMSDSVKSLISVYNTWQNDLAEANKAFTEAKLEIAKTEAALRDLTREIIEAVETPAA